MAQWIPIVETRLDPIEAPDKTGAEAIARVLYGGRLTRVQSAASLQVSDEERSSLRRRRRGFGLYGPPDDDPEDAA